MERRTFIDNRSQVSEPVTLVEEANPEAGWYRDCSEGYSSHGVGGAEHVYTVTALDSNPGPGEEGAFGSASTSLLVYGPSEEPEGPLNVRITQDTQGSRELKWDAPRERRLTTVETARVGTGRQQVVLDPWVTGYRVERQEYRRTGDGYWDVVLEGEWETLREETDGDIRTTFTDATDKGDRQYVYRVRAHSARGLSIRPFRGDWAFNGKGRGKGPGSGPEAAEYVPPPPAHAWALAPDSPATGAAASGGTPPVGETLTAAASGLAEAGGITRAGFI